MKKHIYYNITLSYSDGLPTEKKIKLIWFDVFVDSITIIIIMLISNYSKRDSLQKFMI